MTPIAIEYARPPIPTISYDCKILAIVTIICQAFYFQSVVFSAPSYTSVRLQLPKTFVFFVANELSQDGRVAGYVRHTNEQAPYDIPTVWHSDGSRHSLAVPVDNDVGYANGFQSGGEVLGFYRQASFSYPQAFLSSERKFVTLPDFGKGAIAITANSNIILGESGDANQSAYIYRTTLWDSNGTNPRQVVGLPDVQSRPGDINEGGTYVGNARDYFGPHTGRLRGFVGRDGTASIMQYPGFEISRAFDVNDSDWIVGTHLTAGGAVQRGYVAKAFDEAIFDLGQFPGTSGIVARAINNDGTIVGAALNGTAVRALIWPAGSYTPIDLNTLVEFPGETLVEAIDINNAGQFLARGFNDFYIFTRIPEPALGAVLTVGFLIAQRRVRR